MLKHSLIALITLCALTAYGQKAGVDNLTGSQHTRIAWTSNSSYFDGGGNITGYDSQSDATRVIKSERSWRKVIMCSDGHKIAATSDDWKVYLVDFATGEQTFLVDGFCSSVWKDPQGVEWLFVRNPARTTVRRHRLDNPSVSVLIFNGKSGHDAISWYAVSADGTAGADFLPWSTGFFIENAAALNNQPITTHQVTGGCWSSMSSNNSYVWFHLDGNHALIRMFHRTTGKGTINVTQKLNPAPANNNQIYHPRFASKGGNFLTFTAGYTGNGSHSSAEVYLGKFNADYSDIAGTVRISNNGEMDSNADAWIGVGSAPVQNPAIGLTPTSLDFEAQQGGASPADKTVSVTGTGGTLQGVTVSADQLWLTVTHSDGTVTNKVSIAGLAPQRHSATVTVAATNAVPTTRTYTVTLDIIGTPVATSLDLTPATATVAPGGSVLFTATVKDQYGSPLSAQPAVSWSVAGAGTISAGGLYSAPAQSAASATVKATSGSLSATATVTVPSPAVTLTPTHTGASYLVGQTITIGWEAAETFSAVITVLVGDADPVRIHTQNSFETVNGRGSYDWTIPAQILGTSLIGEEVILQVADYWYSELNAESGVFSIGSSAVLTRGAAQFLREGVSLQRSGGDGSLTLKVTTPGVHRVEILGADGRLVWSGEGAGPATHRWQRSRAATVYFVRLSTAAGRSVHRCVVEY